MSNKIPRPHERGAGPLLGAVVLFLLVAFAFASVGRRTAFDGCQYASTVVFAYSGAIVPWKMVGRRTLFRICIGSTFTANFGGTFRDLTTAQLPFWIREPEYLVISVILAWFVWGARPEFSDKHNEVVDIADRLALGCAAVLGAEKAWIMTVDTVPEVAIFTSFFFSFLTGAGGGLLRDLLLRRPPTALITCYGICAGMGGPVYLAVMRSHIVPTDLAWMITIVTVFALAHASKDLSWPPRHPFESPRQRRTTRAHKD